MKKLLISASLVLATLAASAQDYKPLKGAATAEFGVTGGISNTALTLNNGGGQLRFRYFLADQLAARVGFNITSSSTKSMVYEAGNTGNEGSRVSKTSGITFNLGVEKHFTGSDRLSTYLGADLLIVKNGASGKDENYNGGVYSKDYNVTYKGRNPAGTATSSFGWGLRLVGGADYYFIENVYLGGEFGWGFTSTKNGKTSVATTPGTGAPTTTVENKSTGSAFTLTPQIITGIRLGFKF